MSNQQTFIEDRKVSEIATKKRKWMKKILPLAVVLLSALIIFLVILNLTVLACSRGFRPCETRECIHLMDKFLSSRDSSIDPCQDFFGYVCGNWDTNDTAAFETGSINAFDLLWEENQLVLKDLLERKEPVSKSSGEAKARRFYQSCMDTAKIEELGAQPMIDLINKVGGWSVSGPWNRTDFNQTLRLLIREYNTFPFFRVYSHSSPVNPNINVIQIDHPNFDMPSQSQFEFPSDYAEGLRVYLSYLKKLEELLGGNRHVTSYVTTPVLSFVSKLLNEVTPLAERQERRMLFQATTIAELQDLAPAIDWLSCLQAAFYPQQLNSSDTIFVHDMDYMIGMSRLVEQWSKSRYVQAYMVLCLVQNLSPALDERFQKARRELSISIRGPEAEVMAETPRWKKCVSDTGSFFEPVLGSIFVRETFSLGTKKLAEDIFAEVRTALHNRLHQLEWMDEKLKKDAEDKLQSIEVKIGYPSRLLDDDVLDQAYAELELVEDTFFNNVVKLNAPMSSFHLGPIDPHGQDRWEVEPSSVHSYYSMRGNAVVFPAGMFRSPFFHQDFPSAVNFGTIGVFMAHELLHAFYEYVPRGTVGGAENELEQRLDCMRKQYENYSLQNLTANGTFTLLENMADCGGLIIAHQAYESWLKKQKQETVLPKIGFTHHQLFYASFAQAMCGKQTKEKLSTFLKTDRHSPKPLRVIGAMSNNEDFSRYFQCPSGSTMNPVHKCQVW